MIRLLLDFVLLPLDVPIVGHICVTQSPSQNNLRAQMSLARHGTARTPLENTMTKFSYSDYLSQFRNTGRKCNNPHRRLRGDPRIGRGTTETE